MDKMQLQNAEFDAANRFSKATTRLFATPVVDDDYPEVRHGYEAALSGLLAAVSANGRRIDVPEPSKPEEPTESVDRRALLWLAGGDTGRSSIAIMHHMLGIGSDGCRPSDPADLGRCLRLLEHFPEWKPRIGEMAIYSTAWAALISVWDQLAQTMAVESTSKFPLTAVAHRTYALMNAVVAAREATVEATS